MSYPKAILMYGKDAGIERDDGKNSVFVMRLNDNR
jgi:hypothetical protein